MSRIATKRTLPPAHLLQRIANNPSAADFEASFDPLQQIIRSYLQQAGFDFSSFDEILDFGCGVGRFMFAFEQHLRPGQKIHGAEVHPECARWCRENIKFAETTHTSIDPPLPYKDQKFDLVYALSVYTHLRLDMQFRWAWEIQLVLKPGGVLFATLHGPTFFPLFHAHRDNAVTYEMYGMGDDGFFSYLVFPSEEGLDQGQVQVASAHSPGVVKEQFAGFEIVERFPFSGLAGGQDLFLFRKPLHGRAVALPAEATADCSYTETPQLLRGSRPVELTFTLDDHDSFMVYPRLQPDAAYWVDFHIQIQTKGGKTLVDQTLRLPHNRNFGASHYGKLAVPVPAHRGEVTVKLSSKVTDRGTLPKDVEPKIEWAFPNFI